MKIDRDYVLAYLGKLKEQYGEYFGTELSNFVKKSLALPAALPPITFIKIKVNKNNPW